MMLMTMIIIIIIIISALLPVLSCAVDPTLTGCPECIYLLHMYVRSLGDYDVRPLIGTGSVWRAVERCRVGRAMSPFGIVITGTNECAFLPCNRTTTIHHTAQQWTNNGGGGGCALNVKL